MSPSRRGNKIVDERVEASKQMASKSEALGELTTAISPVCLHDCSLKRLQTYICERAYSDAHAHTQSMRTTDRHMTYGLAHEYGSPITAVQS